MGSYFNFEDFFRSVGGSSTRFPHKLNMLINPTGIRVSLYNAVSEKETDVVIDYIKVFVKQELDRTA
jgi:hypothetical protein